MTPSREHLDAGSVEVTFTGSDTLDFEPIIHLFTEVPTTANVLVLGKNASSN